MGNKSTTDQWAGRERLAFIERLAWWRGVVNRGDVCDFFGISMAQASADLQGYQELNSGALRYNLRSKRYEATAEMKCTLHVPKIEEAVGMFMGEMAWPSSLALHQNRALVSICVPPQRQVKERVERAMFVAILGGRRLKIRYGSVHGGTMRWREIAPHALAFDGLRWHARSWCFEDECYKDFVLSRVDKAEWPGAVFVPPVVDEAWNREVTLVLQVNRELSEEQRAILEMDYGMEDGRLEITVREAMKDYCLAQLHVSVGDVHVGHLELVQS